MIKLGTYLIGDPVLTPAERLRVIRDVGFDHVGFGISTLANSAQSGITPDFCAKLGLKIENLHLTGSGTHDLWAEGERGDAVADRFCDEIAKCREWGVKTGVLHAVYGYEQPAPMGELGLSRFARIVECAEKNGVILALENSLYDDYLCYILDNIQSPCLQFCFDSGHHHAFAADMDLLGKYGARLGATHLHDNDGAKDQHLIPFEGSIDWSATARALAASPHARERICAEITSGPYKGRAFEDIFSQLFAQMTRIAQMIESAK